ncbi:MAG: MOSC domain-containing protein [Candidatus Kapaibacterium sp.]
MITIAELWIYPVKSLAGIRVDSHPLNEVGLVYDREWMITDSDGRFITQREYPVLALVQTAVDDTSLTLCYDGTTVEIPLQHSATNQRTVTVWDDTIQAHDEGEEVARFLTAVLGTNARLVRRIPTSMRSVDSKYAMNNDGVHFGDAMPLHVINTASLDELNSRLDEPVGADRFRANIVVQGASAYHEDTWKQVRINYVDCTVPKATGRCVMTTINQQTAISSKEPLRTLAQYRTIQNKTLFGVYLIHQQKYGVLNVGDEVIIL